MTTWAPIPGWAGVYQASSDGEIRSLDRTVRSRRIKGRTLRPSPNPKGYLIVVLARDGERFAYPVHRLIAETFIGPRPDGWHTCHIDGDQGNNAPSNLRYATPSENELDKRRHGTNANVNKTHCPQGHAYAGSNVMRDGVNGRRCRTCHNARNVAARQAVAS